MQPKDLVVILMTLVNSQGLTEEQRYETIGRFNTAMLNGNAAMLSSNSVSTAGANLEPVVPKPQGPVMITRGTTCKCMVCKKIAYAVIKDVQDQMPDAMFRECFEPVLPIDGDLWGDQQGNVAIDCPLCKSEYTVWIKGEGSYSQTQEQPENFLSRE